MHGFPYNYLDRITISLGLWDRLWYLFAFNISQFWSNSWLKIIHNLPVHWLPFPENPISHWHVAELLVLLQWLKRPQGCSGQPSFTKTKNKYMLLYKIKGLYWENISTMFRMIEARQKGYILVPRVYKNEWCF
jgi:hypothetical protein